MNGDSRVFTFYTLFVETSHVVSAERRHESAHFVKYTSQGPDVTLGIVGHVSPDFRRSVIGRSGLSVRKPLLDNLRDVKVTQLCLHVFKKKDVGAFHVTM